jgi:hypothetical protein
MTNHRTPTDPESPGGPPLITRLGRIDLVTSQRSGRVRDRTHWGMRAVSLIALLVLTLPANSPAIAYVPHSLGVEGQLVPVHWLPEQFPIPFVLNDRSLSLLPNLALNSTPQAAIEAAMRSWSVPPVEVRLTGTAANTEPAPDRINLISFADTPMNRDVTGNLWAITLGWWRQETDRVYTTEADIIFNPKNNFATDGAAAARDIQDLVAHELGHALGLDHTPILAATMYPFGSAGQTLARSLDSDDLAGLRALYLGETGPDVGAITGQVVTTEDRQVFGAYVTATDADGIVRAGAITDPEGNFNVDCLPPGDYQLYAEPLDGPMVPENLWPVFRDTARPVLRAFQTTFAGGNATPAVVNVAAGETTALDPMRVVAQPAGINPRQICWSPDGRSFSSVINMAVQTEAGKSRFLVVAGEGLTGVSPSGFRIGASDFTIDSTRLVRGVLTNGVPYVIFPVAIRAGAPPGARTLYLAGPAERATLTGAIEVISP